MIGLSRRFAFMMLISLLPLGLLALAQTRYSIENAEQALELAALGETLHHAKDDLALMRNAQALVNFIATVVAVNPPDDAGCSAILRSLNDPSLNWLYLGYITPDHRSTCNSGAAITDFNADPQSHALMQATEPRIFRTQPGSLLSQAGGQETVLAITQPVLQADGQNLGYIMALFSHEMREKVDEPPSYTTELGPPSTLISFDEFGNLLTISGKIENIESALPSGTKLKDLPTQSEYTTFNYTKDGQRQLYAVLPLPDSLFILGTWHIDTPALQSQLTLNPFVLLGLTWVIGLVVALWGAERLVLRHLRRLSAAMNNFTFGKRENQDLLLEDPPLEIAYLANAYRALTETITQDEASMANLVQQKEELLREVHHRTGNSLQMIASIMRMHRRESDDADTHALLDSLYDRVMSLSTVHLGLYRISGLSNVPIDQLLAEVIAKVDLLTQRNGSKVKFDVHMAPVLLTAPQAVPLALLLAEILSHLSDQALKQFTISIRLDRYGLDQVRLSLTLPPDLRSLLEGRREGAAALISSRLIRSFIQQLEGEFNMFDIPAREDEPARLQVTVSFNVKS